MSFRVREKHEKKMAEISAFDEQVDHEIASLQKMLANNVASIDAEIAKVDEWIERIKKL